jgi:hypothetical protein
MERKTEPPRLTIKFWPFALDAQGSHAISTIRWAAVIVLVAIAISIPLAIVASSRPF